MVSAGKTVCVVKDGEIIGKPPTDGDKDDSGKSVGVEGAGSGSCAGRDGTGEVEGEDEGADRTELAAGVGKEGCGGDCEGCDPSAAVLGLTCVGLGDGASKAVVSGDRAADDAFVLGERISVMDTLGAELGLASDGVRL